MNAMRTLPFLVLATTLACAHSYIPGTRVRDTSENREVVDLLEKVRTAMEARNAEQILALVSSRYFEDNGTIDPEDDFGFEELRAKFLPESLAAAQEVHLSFEIHAVEIEGDRAHADIRYNSRARFKLPAGSLWDSHREFNRVEFAREDGSWRIVSGL
ncbi:MAG: hypothetical protein HYZ27_08770 [Deltaproteobacteria bacterium]|nr:hypothetical protein [Deltaproteobacteria bacterium]